jgi:hypothetical protein
LDVIGSIEIEESKTPRSGQGGVFVFMQDVLEIARAAKYIHRRQNDLTDKAMRVIFCVFTSCLLMGCATQQRAGLKTRINVTGGTMELYRTRPDLVLERAFDAYDSGVVALEAVKKLATNDLAVSAQLDKQIQTLKGRFMWLRQQMAEVRNQMQKDDGFFYYELSKGDRLESGFLILNKEGRLLSKFFETEDVYTTRPPTRDVNRGDVFLDPMEWLWNPNRSRP